MNLKQMAKKNINIVTPKNNAFSYDEAMLELNRIVEALQNDQIKVDEMTEKIQKANQLIAICRAHLCDVQENLNVKNDFL
jgi:exodeoxyribonuclease VII small subunit